MSAALKIAATVVAACLLVHLRNDYGLCDTHVDPPDDYTAFRAGDGCWYYNYQSDPVFYGRWPFPTRHGAVAAAWRSRRWHSGYDDRNINYQTPCSNWTGL